MSYGITWYCVVMNAKVLPDSVQSSANWITRWKWSWLTLVTGIWYIGRTALNLKELLCLPSVYTKYYTKHCQVTSVYLLYILYLLCRIRDNYSLFFIIESVPNTVEVASSESAAASGNSEPEANFKNRLPPHIGQETWSRISKTCIFF